MTYVMHAVGTFGALALGWYAGREPFSPFSLETRLAIVVGATIMILGSLQYFARR